MESEGALRIFSRFLPNYNVRYVQYLGDGDSKGFLRVQESNIYGDEFPVEKLECIGHVQKYGSKTESPKEQFKIHQAVRQQTDIWTRKADRCRNSSAAKILWPSHKKKCWKISRRYVQIHLGNIFP
ncbi:uncharacterized protein TNCV_31341 [Trichonephila clavipes]|nr:uncharacterized protein TNCV_31341 [Trichonephila clavipes]